MFFDLCLKYKPLYVVVFNSVKIKKALQLFSVGYTVQKFPIYVLDPEVRVNMLYKCCELVKGD